MQKKKHSLNENEGEILISGIQLADGYFENKYSGFTVSLSCTVLQLSQWTIERGTKGKGSSGLSLKLFAGGCSPRFRILFNLSFPQIRQLEII